MIGYFASGDTPFFYDEQIRQLSFLPKVFDASIAFGTSVLPRLWIDYPFRLVVKILGTLGLSWVFLEKLLWSGIVLLAFYGMYRLSFFLFKKRLVALFSSILYVVNTYFLLLFAGGQFGVALGYAFVPFVLYLFIKAIRASDRPSLRTGMANGLAAAFLVVSDLRIAIITAVIIVSYVFFSYCVEHRQYKGKDLFFLFGIPLLVSLGIHAFWLFPIFLFPATVKVDEVFTSVGMVNFLSFADFSHTLSLLHPNWPENLFGKVYFLQPEFLLLPILAFGSLLLSCNRQETCLPAGRAMSKGCVENKKYILFFACIALLGAFLSKGTNPPFGEIYAWIFNKVPGFSLFRDPTKFYMFAAVSYALLVPFTIRSIAHISFIKPFRFLFYGLLVISFVFLYRPIVLGTMPGNFKLYKIPSSYEKLKNILIGDRNFGRTLWLPRTETFSYRDDMHPILTAEDIWNESSVSGILTHVKDPSLTDVLKNAGVKYVIVPSDIEKRIFLTDYHYDDSLRVSIVDAFDANKNFTKRLDGDGLHVYENSIYNDAFSLPPFVGKQEKASHIGLFFSICTLVGSILFLLLPQKNKA